MRSVEESTESDVSAEVNTTHHMAAWELDVKPLTSSKKWLKSYGLKKNRLTLNHILPAIGFQLNDEFDGSTMMKKPISSQYGYGIFSRLTRPDGKTFNITGSKQKLHQIQKRLIQAEKLYKRRLEWLTTESRRIFGIIEEKVVIIILDVRNMSPQQFDQYRTAMEKVLREQVTQLTKFNIIRACEERDAYSQECVPVTHDTVEKAIQWIWRLDRLAEVSTTATCEAVLHAVTDKNNEAIYLFTEGTSSDSSREILREKVTSCRLNIPIHIVSYNCSSADTIKYLRTLATATNGRFHAYAVVMEMDSYEHMPVDPLMNKANIVLKKRTIGGLPPGVGVREDVILVFEELEDARNILRQITSLLQKTPEPRLRAEHMSTDSDLSLEKNEHSISSAEWIKRFGLEAQKLGLYDILSGVAFKHQDGVVEIMEKPPNESQTDAVSRTKLVNARYCDQFPIVRWRDGQVVHVQVTPDVHRHYEQRMEVELQKIQQRIDWLKQGSRELFGTVLEDNIYILLDCSASMQNSMHFVQEKLFMLMQEQLRHKKKLNLVSFNSKCLYWRDRLVEVNERSLQSAWAWVQGLSCWGSTNTYAAITHAMNDLDTQAMYLLTDGRPDQPPKSILAQVQMKHRVPIHTISFNCNDTEANRFLYELARTTTGRYHYFSEKGVDLDQPEAWESEDVQLLKHELKHGQNNLEQLATLRDQCSSMAWRRQTDDLKRDANENQLPGIDKSLRGHPDNTRDKFPLPRPKSAPPQEKQSLVPSTCPLSSNGLRSSSSIRQSISKRSNQKTTHAQHKQPLTASHTRTSLLRTLNSAGRFTRSKWLLPETKQLFDRQAERQHELHKVSTENENRRKRNAKRHIRENDVSSKVWLKKNSLMAKRLTILDALSPTFVPHRSKYVPILDRHVVARVFDQIIPLAHVSNRSRQEIRLVSPNAVDLNKYQEQVRQAIDQYHGRLNQIVWNALPESTKEKYETNKPFSFFENREGLITDLAETDWQMKEEDVKLLVQEIEKGQKFLQQARDLKAAAEQTSSCHQSVTTGQHMQLPQDTDSAGILAQITAPSNVDSELESRWQSKQHGGNMQQEAAGEEEALAAGNTSTLDASNADAVQKIVQKHEKGLLANLSGQKVIARDKHDGMYYEGVVVACPNPRYARVRRYFDEKTMKISTKFILPTRGAVSNPPLRVGDYVLVRVINLTNDTDCYIPGIMQIPSGKIASFYSVLVYNSQTIVTMRRHLVKISKERFDFTVDHICQMLREENGIYFKIQQPPEPDVKISVQYEDGGNNEAAVENKQKHRRPMENKLKDHINDKSDTGRKKHRNMSRHKFERHHSENGHAQPSGSSSNSEGEVAESCDSCQSNLSQCSSSSPFETNSISSKSHTASEPDTDIITHESKMEKQHSDNNDDSSCRPDSTFDDLVLGSHDSLTARLKEHEERLKKLQKQLQNQDQKHREEQEEVKRTIEDLRKQQKERRWQAQRLLNAHHHHNEESVSDLGEMSNATKAKDLTGAVALTSPSDEDQHSSLMPVKTQYKDTKHKSLALLEMRKSLPPVKDREEVLARWTDEGWYYRGRTVLNCQDFSYMVVDSTGEAERIWREDIITESDDANHIIKVNDTVVGLHPKYSFSYAPAFIVELLPQLKVRVHFYDNKIAVLQRDEVYKISQVKYRHDVREIHKCENQWVGQAVVARHYPTGVYRIGSVIEKVPAKPKYRVEWCDGTSSMQSPVHMFGAFTRRHKLTLGERILALRDHEALTYLPGQITGIEGSNLKVQFCDGAIMNGIVAEESYWLSLTYYDNAVCTQRSST
ncbi:von Willebrand factor A domain-containing protein 3B-like [Haliotis cracherodii]|uniref:von Willebrand factor A domain-containing protein 3B-like n=1 Tax=Haliotis cracherodii TaxID=6455 RepID=UPI0039ED001D